jgi:GDPmannose 4,6-dehydratase
MKALITGITGQDGSFLAEFLLDKGYEVHGIIRRSSSFNTDRLDHIFSKLHLHYGDLSDANCLAKILGQVRPDEVYNLGCQSHVRVSFDEPIHTVDTVAMGTLRLLEAVKNTSKKIRVYQASSSEMFGSSAPPQNEQTPFHPRSPYACGKVFAYHQIVNYREAHALFTCNGILFNHESERRGETFVTRKITRAATRIKLGLQKELRLGNLDAKRDWGYAGDYVEAMWLMLQQGWPSDYVIATGETHSVKEFLTEVFEYLELDWTKYVKYDKRYERPTEVDALQGDSSKARADLGWEPKVDFKKLVRLMVDADMALAEKEKVVSEMRSPQTRIGSNLTGSRV